MHAVQHHLGDLRHRRRPIGELALQREETGADLPIVDGEADFRAGHASPPRRARPSFARTLTPGSPGPSGWRLGDPPDGRPFQSGRRQSSAPVRCRFRSSD